jgi:hypothetical protein
MRWTSCCRDRRRNCPSIAMSDGHLLIRDDDGSIVKIKLESAHDLILTIQEKLPTAAHVSGPTCSTA